MKRVIFLLLLSVVFAASALAECEHTNVTYEPLDPFCNGEEGHWEYWYCSDCQKYFEDSWLACEVDRDELFFSNFKGHYWTEWSIEEPTQTDNGYAERWCQSGCGKHERHTLEKPGDSTILIQKNKIQAAAKTGVLDLTEESRETNGLQMDAEWMTDLAKANEVTIKFNSGSVKADAKTLNGLVDAIDEDHISLLRLNLEVGQTNLLNNAQEKAVEGLNVQSVVLMELLLNGKMYEDNFAGEMQVEFAFETDTPEACRLLLVHEDGTTETVSAAFNGKTCIANREHFSAYVIDQQEIVVDLPATGDKSSFVLWMGMLALCLGAYAAGKRVRA